MPCFCGDEILMLMAMLPFIGFYFHKLHVWYHNKFKHKCHKETCNDKHLVHEDEKKS